MRHKAYAKRSSLFVVKEFVLALLALLSVATVITEVTMRLSDYQVGVLNRVDFVIACIFLFDFVLELHHAQSKTNYLKKNWYLLLAAIPLTDTLTDALRGVRLLRLVRIIRAGEHLDISYRTSKQNK